jgi:hypothetical protein
MFKISEQSVATLSTGNMHGFVDRCLQMLHEYFPDLLAMSDRETVVDQIHAAAENASMAGFEHEPEAIQFVYLHFLLGDTFATDPQYAWLDRIMTAQGETAEQRMDNAMDAVAGRMDAGRPLEDPLTPEEQDVLGANA